jgi:hypothetical protein
MATKKATTKQDLENKIAELEAKLNKLSTDLEVAPDDLQLSQVNPDEVTKPKGTLPKGFETKPKGTLPKGFETKSTDAPKPAETKTQLSVTITAGSMIL